jgi:hypothetical protein
MGAWIGAAGLGSKWSLFKRTGGLVNENGGCHDGSRRIAFF